MKVEFKADLFRWSNTYIQPIPILQNRYTFLAILFTFLNSTSLTAQTNSDTASALSLDQCINYALENDLNVKQARLDEEIGEREIRANLSGWLPQISAQYNFAHNFKLPTSAFGENLVQIGRKNTSNILFEANQAIYSNELLLASRAASYRRLQLEQNTQAIRINTVVEVSKSFYDIQLTNEQLRILDENIGRQEKQYNDAYSRYEFGLVDKTDYQRASITLANSRSDKKRTQEVLKAKYAYLKQLMGYPLQSNLKLSSDLAQMEAQASVDTMQALNYSNRIEFLQLQSERQLLSLNTTYYQLGFIPTISAFINYNFVYLNNDLSQLYRQSYPTSQGGLSAALPIFQGTRRLQNIRIAKLQEDRSEMDLENIKYRINTEYQNALADYKSNYMEWITLRQNVAVSKEVYDIIKLQYDEGVKAYIDLVLAETSLKATEINYYNALYQLLESKLDLERALGNIKVNP
jgi:outer membrane protein TolC